MSRHGNPVLVALPSSAEAAAVRFSLRAIQDVVTLLAELPPKQYAFSAEVSKDWSFA